MPSETSPERWEPVVLDEPEPAPLFRVGDRVRIRLSPECRITPPPRSIAEVLGWTGHPSALDGRTGVVVPWPDFPHTRIPGHPHYVELDEAVPLADIDGRLARFTFDGQILRHRWEPLSDGELELLERPCPS